MDYLRARKDEEKDQRCRSIVDAARSLFAIQGVDATTVDQIAVSCRLSRSLIYTYFLDKNHIFLTVVSEALELMLKDFREIAATGTSGLDRVFSIGWAFVSFAQSKPEYYDATVRFQPSRLLQRVQQGGNGKEGLLKKFESDLMLVATLADQINQLIAEQIVIGMQDTSIRGDIGDPLETALSLWAITAGLIQTASANEQTFAGAYGISKNAIISQGLALAKQGLQNKGGQS